MAFLELSVHGELRAEAITGAGRGPSSCSLLSSPASSPGSVPPPPPHASGTDLLQRLLEVQVQGHQEPLDAGVWHLLLRDALRAGEHVLKPRAPQAGGAGPGCTGPAAPTGLTALAVPATPTSAGTRGSPYLQDTGWVPQPGGGALAPGSAAFPESASSLSCCRLRAFAPDGRHWQDSPPSPCPVGRGPGFRPRLWEVCSAGVSPLGLPVRLEAQRT